MIEYPTLAVFCVERVLVLDDSDMTAHSFLWALANSDEAAACSLEVYRRLASSGDVKAAHKLAALTGEGKTASKGDPGYARQIYDDMAGAFESKLVDTLGYRGPWQLHDLVRSVIEGATGVGTIAFPAEGVWRLLDLGCGSGLCGRVFTSLVGGLPSAIIPSSHPPSSPHLPVISTASSESAAAATTTTTTTTTTTGIDNGTMETEQGDGLEAIERMRFRPGGIMMGVDVSLRMVEITRRNGGYDAVGCGDLEAAINLFGHSCGAFTSSPNSSSIIGCDAEVEVTKYHSALGLDLVIAADTFIYVGALGHVFARVRKALRTGGAGLFVFSIENLDLSPMRVISSPPTSSSSSPGIAAVSSLGDKIEEQGGGSAEAGSGECLIDDELPGAVPGWGAQLLTSARFAHSPRYIEALAAAHGFRMLRQQAVTLRKEKSISLPGDLFVLQLCF